MSNNPSQVNTTELVDDDYRSSTNEVSRLEVGNEKKKASTFNGGMLAASITTKAAVISPRTLYCEALAHCLNDEFDVMYGVFRTLNDFITAMRHKDPSGVIIILMESYIENTFEDIAMILGDLIDPSVVIIGDEKKYNSSDSIQQNVKAIIPVSSTLIIALQAIRLVQYGGVFFPRNNLEESHRKMTDNYGKNGVLEGLTRTQLEVAEALRTGKSNKLIAHSLGMNEHTVKVHVRNILKRLGAGNRTEAALIISRNRYVPQSSV